MSSVPWSSEDSTSLREFFRRVPRERIAEVMRDMCPAVVDAETVLKNDAEAVARVAAMRAGWDDYEKNFFALADVQRREQVNPEYRDMT
jgi:hypothetical protein